MIRADELKPGDITPFFTVGEIVDPYELDPLVAGAGELAIREHGGRKSAGVRHMIQRSQLIEVIGCVKCGKGHEVADCPRRALAEDVPEDAAGEVRAAAAMAVRPAEVAERHPEIAKHLEVRARGRRG